MKITKVSRIYYDQPSYRLHIIEQPYIRRDFGNPMDSFRSSKGFTLRSINNPAVTTSNAMYVRGDNTHEDNISLTVHAEFLRKVMHAVREYNSHLIIADLPGVPEEDTFIIE